MSISRNLSSLGTIVTSNSGLNVTFANSITAIFTAANLVNLSVSGNSTLNYISANSSLGTSGNILISGGSSSNVYWSSISTIINPVNFSFSNTISFLGDVTFSNPTSFSNTVTFSNAIINSTVSIANINSSYISNTTFNNYREQTVSNSALSTSYTPDLAVGSMHILTLTSNTTVYMPIANSGKSFTLIFNTGNGYNFISWNNVLWSDNVAPVTTITANKRDIFSFISDGTNWYGFIAGQNF